MSCHSCKNVHTKFEGYFGLNDPLCFYNSIEDTNNKINWGVALEISHWVPFSQDQDILVKNVWCRQGRDIFPLLRQGMLVNLQQNSNYLIINKTVRKNMLILCGVYSTHLYSLLTILIFFTGKIHFFKWIDDKEKRH